MIDEILQASNIESSIFLTAMLFFFISIGFSPTFIFLHLLLPKIFLKKYWRVPYFRPGEIGFMDSFAFGLQRTNMLTWVIVLPRLGKKREMLNAYLDVPTWYLWLCRIWHSIFSGSLFFAFGLIFSLIVFALFDVLRSSGM
jgi:hypothetical protein